MEALVYFSYFYIIYPVDESVSIYWLFYFGSIGVDLFMFIIGHLLCFRIIILALKN